MQDETLFKLRQDHQGIERCRLRAQTSVWWPGILSKINEMVERCPQCSRDRVQNKEPLIPTPLPDHPWQKLGSDLFVQDGTTYILVVDYYSRYPEVIQLKTTTMQSIIHALKIVFSRNGIPQTIFSDNGPQYTSREFAAFAQQYRFIHNTSSPHLPKSNGMAERTVKTVKGLLKDAADPHLALLTYRATPLPWCQLSPAELLMGRKLRTDVPSTTFHTPQWRFLKEFREKDKERKKQKEEFDRRHRTRTLPDIPDNLDVWVTTRGNPVLGQTVRHSTTPCSYVVSTPSGTIRRNRRQINLAPSGNTPQPQQPNHADTREPIMIRTRTGTAIFPPERLT